MDQPVHVRLWKRGEKKERVEKAFVIDLLTHTRGVPG